MQRMWCLWVHFLNVDLFNHVGSIRVALARGRGDGASRVLGLFAGERLCIRVHHAGNKAYRQISTCHQSPIHAHLPIRIADTLLKVATSPKNTIPEMAIGSLLSEPTIEYVVEDVVRTHQAEAYDMPNAETPEKIMAQTRAWRCSGGLYTRRCQYRHTWDPLSMLLTNSPSSFHKTSPPTAS